MRALAEYVMRGRRNAAMAIMLFGFIPFVSWLSPSIVALVALRKGISEGVLMALWALLPAIYFWREGDGVALPLIIVVLVSSLVLRRTISLEFAVLTQLVIAAITTVVVVEFKFLPYEMLLDVFKQLLAKVELNKQITMPLLEPEHYELLVANFYSLSLGSMALLALLVARWWQAMLYNPGGFQQEFHQLRLPPLWATGITALLLTAGANPLTGSLVLLLTLPILIAGLALVHGGVKSLGAGRRSLSVFYIALFMLGPYLYIPLLVLAVADSFFDFRRRLKKISRN